jgi:hypothetical protein
MAIDRVARVNGASSAYLMSLQDNRATAGAIAKGRSPSYPLNTVCRRVGAISMAAELRLLAPWVSTKDQPADEASREECDVVR